MKFKFSKDHVSGLGKGSVVKIEEAHGARLEKEDFGEAAGEKDAYAVKPSYVADPGKAKREAKQKEALVKQKRARAVREANRKQ